jgi:hypothetical protein
MISLDLWEHFIREFRSTIAEASEERLSLAWSSAKTRTSFYEEMLAPLATRLGAVIEQNLDTRSELFKVDFAICLNSYGIKVPIIFIESENNAFSAEHEVRKLVNLAAPLRVLITVIQWDEESGVWDKAYKSTLLPRWEKIICQHQTVWPRPGVLGILVGEWRPNKMFRFYGYAYEEGNRLGVPNPEIILERKVNHKDPRMWLPLSKGLGIAFCDPVCEEVSAAQQWLRSGRGDIPNARWLACSVDGYERRGDVATFSEWVRTKLPFITPDLIESLSIQELLDLLFYFHRAERFAEGTLLEMTTEIETIVTSIAHRVIDPNLEGASRE